MEIKECREEEDKYKIYTGLAIIRVYIQAAHHIWGKTKANDVCVIFLNLFLVTSSAVCALSSFYYKFTPRYM